MSRTPKQNINANRKRILRQMLIQGNVEEAGQKSAEWGIDILDIRLPADAEAPPEVVQPPDESMKQVLEPKPHAPELPTSPLAIPPPIQTRWPEESDLVIQGQPINKRLALARLPDQRRVLMWKRNGQYPASCKVRARLCDQVGPDAYYEPVSA